MRKITVTCISRFENLSFDIEVDTLQKQQIPKTFLVKLVSNFKNHVKNLEKYKQETHLDNQQSQLA